MHMDKNLADYENMWKMGFVLNAYYNSQFYTVVFIFATCLDFVCNVGILVGITKFTKRNLY